MAVVEEPKEEGEEVRVEDYQRWSALIPRVGEVLEVHVGSTSLPIEAETWAAFLILGTATETDGSHLLTCRMLGCEDAEIGVALASDQCAGDVALHLCLSKPCITTRDMTTEIHVTHVRLWSWEGFKSTGYLPPETEALVKELMKPDRGRRAKATPRPKGEKPEKAKPRTPRTPKAKVAPGSGLTSEMKDSLREKLGKVRSRLKPGAKMVAATGEDGEEKTREKDIDEIEEVSEEYTPSYAPLGTGTTLGTMKEPAIPLAIGDRSDRVGVKKDSSGITSKSLSGQLIMRAMQRTKERKQAQRKKKAKMDKETTMVKLLSKILTSKETGSKKKSKKKRRRMDDGVIVSCSGSSSDTSVSAEEEMSDSDLEAPLRKKSRDKPGSVLKMLTDHIRQQMDQTAVAEMASSSRQLTGGVKVASYFQLQIKGQFPQYQRELREMYSLAATLDLLRIGDVGRVGDSLAARFMALHQFMLDANWNTARYMELHSMEDSNAATPAVILASRKHSRLVDRVQGRGWGGGSYGYFNRGKGRGKTGWQGYGDGYQDQKGEKGKQKGKGKKGKGRGDGKWDGKVKDWEGAKAHVEDK